MLRCLQYTDDPQTGRRNGPSGYGRHRKVQVVSEAKLREVKVCMWRTEKLNCNKRRFGAREQNEEFGGLGWVGFEVKGVCW